MIAQILDFEPAFLISSTFNDSVVSSQEYLEDRRRALERCLEEDQYYLNEPLPQGVLVPFGRTEEHFLDRFFAGWDDGFLLAYKRKSSFRENYCERGSCANDEFHKNQMEDLGRFAIDYRNMLEEKVGVAISLEESLKSLLEKYSQGFGAGYRAGYCGFVCPKIKGCYQGKIHEVSDAA